MKRMLSTAAVLFLALGGSAWADKTNEGKKVPSDPFPRADAVAWDVLTFEGSPAFEVVKREVKGNSVTWVLENRRALGTEITLGYQALFLDADGVNLLTLGVEVEPFFMNLAKGERNRFVLHLPRPEQWKSARKVVIKNGLYSN